MKKSGQSNNRDDGNRDSISHELDNFDEFLRKCNDLIKSDPDASYPHYLKFFTIYNTIIMETMDDKIHASIFHAISITGDYIKKYEIITKEMEDAINEINMAIKFDPNNALYHDEKGTTLTKFGQYEEAIKEIDIAIKLNLENGSYHGHRAEALRKLDRIEEANKEEKIKQDLSVSYSFEDQLAALSKEAKQKEEK